jgi:hypothetical protein
MENKKSRVSEAFKEGFNVVGLGSAAALSLALLNPLPLIIGAFAEAAYLLFVPDSKWYANRLSQRADAEVEARRNQLKNQVFPQIADPVKERFERLERIRSQIGTQGDNSQDWFRQVVRKLDYLLEKFLMFASKEAQFRQYLQSVYVELMGEQGNRPGVRRRDRDRDRNRRRESRPEDYDLFEEPAPVGDRWVEATVRAIQTHYDTDVEGIAARRDAEQDLNTKAILEKRIEVLQQRREYIGKMGKILTNLTHQMELLEDSFGLINDQIRAQSPEQVLADIEGVVYQTDSMTKLLEELAPYEQMSARLAA